MKLNETVALAKQVVQEYGEDHIGLQYSNEGCLVGVMLQKAGVHIPLNMMSNSILYLIDHGVVKVEDSRTLNFLISLQNRNDWGHTWGYALQMAKALIYWQDPPVEVEVTCNDFTTTAFIPAGSHVSLIAVNQNVQAEAPLYIPDSWHTTQETASSQAELATV